MSVTDNKKTEISPLKVEPIGNIISSVLIDIKKRMENRKRQGRSENTKST
jgi:hypothetical protein